MTLDDHINYPVRLLVLLQRLSTPGTRSDPWKALLSAVTQDPTVT